MYVARQSVEFGDDQYGVLLLAQTVFIIYAVMRAPNVSSDQTQTVGKTLNIGQAMYTQYLLPVEIVGVFLLMAIIGSVILVRRLSQPQLELVVEEELKDEHLKKGVLN